MARSTDASRALERRLRTREAAAEREFWNAFENQSAISRGDFERFLQSVGRPLTWRIWNIALDELDRLVR